MPITEPISEPPNSDDEHALPAEQRADQREQHAVAEPEALAPR